MSSEFWVGPAAAPDTYRLVSLLGGGGEGEVWQAVLPLSTEGRRSVAVKIMRGTGERDEAERWARFGHLLRSLSHPGLVRVTDVFTGPAMHRAGEPGPGTCLYVVMDHIEGTNLREWCVDNPDTSASQRLRMLRMVASALDEMHSGATTEVPVAHGDVKPANIVVRPDGGAVLVDLGLARLTDATGVMGRSAPYAAPELRVPGAMATPEADRYAFAVALAEALTAQPPPLGRDGWLDPRALLDLLRAHPITGRRHLLVQQIMNLIAAPPDARPQQLRPWLDAAVDSLSQVTTDDTVTGPLAVAARQSPQFAHPQPTTRIDPPAPPTGSPRRRSRVPLIITMGVLVVLLAGAGAIALLRGGDDAGGSRTDASAATGLSPTPTPAAPTTDATPTSPTASAVPIAEANPSSSAPPSAAVGSGAITYLAELRPIDGSWDHSGTLAIDGKTYTHALVDQDCSSPSRPRTMEYDLARAYSSFQAVVGMSDDTDSGAEFRIEFFVDGLPQGQLTVKRGKVDPVTLSVRGVLTLKVIVSTVTGAQCDRGYPGLALGDPQLIS
ncbi:MAG: protein kinase [Pseudonocardia sp.]|nr:protein kinase [Pseudonocardia sp.]